jgi:hypothetical protein
MAGAPPVGPPSGCRVNSQSFSPGSCGIGHSCDNGYYVNTYCGDYGNGVWSCDCSNPTMPQTYQLQLTGVKDLAACEAASEFCISGVPTPSGPAECESRLETRTASNCELQRVCSQELEGDGAARLSTINQVYCQDDGTGRQVCSCFNQPYQYYVEGENGTTACDTLIDYCNEPVTTTFGEPQDCQPQYQSGGTGYCDTQNICLRTGELADGIYVLAQGDYVRTNCGNGADGSAFCNCQNSAGSFTLELDAPVTGVASCEQATAVCQKLTNVEPDGEPVCTNSSQSAQTNYCNATIDCAASATVDDVEVSLHGYIGVACSGDASGWTCSCSSNSEYDTVTVQGETAWEACTHGSAACQEAIEVQFGNGGVTGAGGSSGRPVPPPGTAGRPFF